MGHRDIDQKWIVERQKIGKIRYEHSNDKKDERMSLWAMIKFNDHTNKWRENERSALD